MSQIQVELEVMRYRPEMDDKPFFQTYQVHC